MPLCSVGTTLARGAAGRQQPKRFHAPCSIRREARSRKGITMVRHVRLVAALTVLSMLLFAHPAVIAQDATPAAGEVIDPAECQVEPRTIEEIEQLVGTAGEAEEATPGADQREATALAGVSNVRQIAGGRVTARVETTSSPEGTVSVVQGVLEP